MKGLMGTKIAMTQVFDSTGMMIPVTIIKAEPNIVLNNMNESEHGYSSAQLGYGKTKVKNATRPRAGVFKKAGSEPLKRIREFRNMKIDEGTKSVDLTIFKVGEIVDVEGVSKGHGFTGAIERWNMKIGPMSHGAGYPHRYQGSLGGGRGGSSAQHVFKGKKMSGRYGGDNTTVENLQVIDIDLDNSIVLIKGSIPGPKGSIVSILKSQKKFEKQTPVKLVDIKAEALRNVYLEEAKHFGVQLTADMSPKQMNQEIEKAKAEKAAQAEADKNKEQE